MRRWKQTFQCHNSLGLIYQILSECDEKLQCIKEYSYRRSRHFTLLTLKADSAEPHPVHRWLENAAKRFLYTCDATATGMCCYFVISVCRRHPSTETPD